MGTASRFGRRALLTGAAVALAGCATRRRRPPRVVDGVRLGRNLGFVTALAFTHDGRQIVSGHAEDGGWVRFWDVGARKLARSFQTTGSVYCIAMPRQRDLLAISGWRDQHGGYLSVLESTTGRELRSIEAGLYGISLDQLAVTAAGALVASYSARGESEGSKLWDVDSGALIRRYPHATAALAADGRTALGGNTIWDVETGRVKAKVATSSYTWGVAISADGGRAISQSSGEGAAFLWNDRGERIGAFGDQRRWLWGATFCPDDRFLITAAEDVFWGSRRRLLVLRDGRTGTRLAELGGHRAAVHAVVFSPDGRHAVSGDAGGDIYLWTMPDR